MNIRVKIFQDRMGNIIGYPIRQDIREKIINHLADFNIKSDGSFFLQEGMDAGLALEFISDRLYRDLLYGWDIYPIIDAWAIGHFYGWDTHTIFE